MPTASRWPACARRSGSASARCLDVLNAEQELLNSEVTLATDRRNLVVASYTVLFTIGRLNAQELGVAALVYDPEQHYQEVRRKWFDMSITHGDGRIESLTPRRPPCPRSPAPSQGQALTLVGLWRHLVPTRKQCGSCRRQAAL